MLASCNRGGGSSTTSSSSSSSSSTSTSTSTSTPPDPTIYGTRDEPLSIAQWTANVKTVVDPSEGTFSDHPFYVIGIADKSAALSTTYSNIFLHDKVDDNVSCKIQKAVNGGGISSKGVYRNDKLIVKGYVEYYAGGYSLYPDGEDNPAILSITRGKSKFSKQVDENVSITSPTSFESEYTNLEEISVQVAPDAGYLALVEVNKVRVQPVDGVYTVVIKGDTELHVYAEPDVPKEDLPAGTYTVTIDTTNSGLSDSASNDKVISEFTLKADGGGHYYKKLTLEWSKACYNKTQYSELALPGSKKGSVIFRAPNGNLSTITNDYYSYQNAIMYKGEDREGEEIVPTDGTPSSKTGSLMKIYTVNNPTAFLIEETTYEQCIHSITVKVVVE